MHARATTRTRRGARSRRVVALLITALGAGVFVLGSCNAFSTLSPPANDGGGDGATSDSRSVEGGEAGDLPGLLSLGEALQLCSKVLTCPHVGPSIASSFGLPVDFTNFSQCVHVLSGPIDPRRINRATAEGLRCAATVDGCNVGPCVAAEEINSDDPRIDPACADGGAGEKCVDGVTVVSCVTSTLRGAGGWAFHCDNPSYATGSKCLAANGSAACNLATAGCPPSPRCVDGVEPLSVSDFCFDAGGVEAHTKLDCRTSGRSCQVGVLGCAGTPCGIHLQGQCVGTKSAALCRFGTLVMLDCASAGGNAGCETHDLVSYCAGPHEECSPYDPAPAGGQGVNSCDGSSIRLCVGGRRVSVDCRQAGANFTCRTGNVPKSNYCGPPP